MLTYFADPDPMSLGTFSPPPGMGLATGAGATVEATAPTLIFPPEIKKDLFRYSTLKHFDAITGDLFLLFREKKSTLSLNFHRCLYTFDFVHIYEVLSPNVRKYIVKLRQTK